MLFFFNVFMFFLKKTVFMFCLSFNGVFIVFLFFISSVFYGALNVFLKGAFQWFLMC